MKITEWIRGHECIRRALRTFLQAAAGVIAAAIVNAAGVVKNIDIDAVIALAVATGLAAVMNRGGTKEETDDDGTDENGRNESGI